MKDKVKLDMVTGRPLTRSFNLHHLSQSKDIEDYKNLEPSRYIPLNSASHDMIHFLYNIVEREENYDVFGRILAIIMAMKQLTIQDEEKKQ